MAVKTKPSVTLLDKQLQRVMIRCVFMGGEVQVCVWVGGEVQVCVCVGGEVQVCVCIGGEV